MKRIYFTLIILSTLIITSVNAQKQFCYTNYTFDTIAYNPVLSYNVGTQIPLHTDYLYYSTGIDLVPDSFSAIIPIGFNFNFYGNNYNSLVISQNGYISFDTSYAFKPSQDCLPTGNPLNSIFLFFGHLERIKPVLSGSVNYSTIGIAPNRMFIVSYDSLNTDPIIDGADTIWSYFTGQIVLYETTSIIEMYILHSDNYSPNTCGMGWEAVNNESGSLKAIIRYFNNGVVQNDGRRVIPHNLPHPSTTPICMVTVDSLTGKNMVVWDKPVGIPIDSFIIYKETASAGVYAPIGTQPYSTFSTFIDTGSNPAQQANRYQLGFRDSCGVIALNSAEQKTIHLSISQGIGNTWNLSWDSYEGLSFSSYNLYRGTTSANMSLLTTIPSDLFTYTDLNPPVESVYYAIGFNVSACDPTARTANAYTGVLSNIVSNHVTGVPAFIDESSITVFPNPADKLVNVRFKLNAKTDLSLVMNDVTGRVVYSTIYNDISNLFEQQIDCGNLSRGVYFLQIKTDGGNYNRKIVVE